MGKSVTGRLGTSNFEVLGSIPGKSTLRWDRTQDFDPREEHSLKGSNPEPRGSKSGVDTTPYFKPCRTLRCYSRLVHWFILTKPKKSMLELLYLLRCYSRLVRWLNNKFYILSMVWIKD